MSLINEVRRFFINRKNREKLENKDFSLIASNCNGCMLLHDLGLRFNSPFVNLWIGPKDFLKLLENFDGYMNSELSFIKEDGVDYPVGLLNDIKIYFQHYHSEEEAKDKWNERRKRINKENLYVMFTDRDGCTYEDLQQFDALPYKKVVFVHKPYSDIKCACYVPSFEQQNQVGHCFKFINKFSGYRKFDCFDYVDWLNS